VTRSGVNGWRGTDIFKAKCTYELDARNNIQFVVWSFTAVCPYLARTTFPLQSFNEK